MEQHQGVEERIRAVEEAICQLYQNPALQNPVQSPQTTRSTNIDQNKPQQKSVTWETSPTSETTPTSQGFWSEGSWITSSDSPPIQDPSKPNEEAQPKFIERTWGDWWTADPFEDPVFGWSPQPTSTSRGRQIKHSPLSIGTKYIERSWEAWWTPKPNLNTSGQPDSPNIVMPADNTWPTSEPGTSGQSEPFPVVLEKDGTWHRPTSESENYFIPGQLGSPNVVLMADGTWHWPDDKPVAPNPTKSAVLPAGEKGKPGNQFIPEDIHILAGKNQDLQNVLQQFDCVSGALSNEIDQIMLLNRKLRKDMNHPSNGQCF
ncbi:uncharacterized protein LOC128990471 isoform X2 [Macrosteles quadrilineatus]|nr:uncharacterized protein LOC128990471 isoform X2 [Macrosteles quadrilineatus]